MPSDPSTTAAILSERPNEVTPKGALRPSAVDQVVLTTDVPATKPMTSPDIGQAG